MRQTQVLNDLSPNQIEELDLDDYDTYENALEQELNRTIAQSEKEQEYSRGRNRQSDMRQIVPITLMKDLAENAGRKNILGKY